MRRERLRQRSAGRSQAVPTDNTAPSEEGDSYRWHRPLEKIDLRAQVARNQAVEDRNRDKILPVAVGSEESPEWAVVADLPRGPAEFRLWLANQNHHPRLATLALISMYP